MPHEAPASERPRLILASGSPRRRALLEAAGVRFSVQPAHIPERRAQGEPPADFAERLAREKALAVARLHPQTLGGKVLGSDTVVALGDRVFGKPESEDHALELLEGLVGRTHEVITGIAVALTGSLEVRSRVVRSTVRMRPASRAELVEYLAVGESMDKAGAYALQGEAGRRFVEHVEGSESNVIGLPLAETLALLELPSPPELDALEAAAR